MISDFRDIIFLDIETVACTDDFSCLDERHKAQWARKVAYFKREQPQETDESLFHLRAGIYAEFGKIVCIGVGKFTQNESGELALRTKAYYGHDEKGLLTEFKMMIERLDPLTLKLCAHNGKEFDFPYICRRMLVNGIPLPPALHLSGKKSWEVQHIDTMEMWKFGDYKHYTSLELLACIFNIPSSKDDMDGSQINSVYYKENNLEKIKTYCLKDVVVMAQLYLKMKGLNLVEDKNIIMA